MLEQLFNLVKNESVNEIINNPAIPNEQNHEAIGMATDSIFGGLKESLGGGGLKNVLGMFAAGGTSSSHPILNNIIQHLTGGFMNKFGMNASEAGGLAGSLIPNVVNKLIHKTNDPNDTGFSINGIMGALTGSPSQQDGPVSIPGLSRQGGGVDFGSILNNFGGSGLDANHDGQLGLDDLSGLVGGMVGKPNASSSTSESGEGGVMGMLKGLMD